MAADGDATEGICYVCMDESAPAPRSQCACRNMFLHRVCQREMVSYQQNPTRCSICKSHYKNVHILHIECGVRVLLVWLCTSMFLYTSLKAVDDSSIMTSAAAACYFAAYIMVLLYAMWANVCPICARETVVRLL